MDVIFAKIILEDEEEKVITKQDLINEGYDCEIFVNENRLADNMILKKDNYIIYILKQKYDNLQNMFNGCSLLTSINLTNLNTNKVTTTEQMFYNCSSLT